MIRSLGRPYPLHHIVCVCFTQIKIFKKLFGAEPKTENKKKPLLSLERKLQTHRYLFVLFEPEQKP